MKIDIRLVLPLRDVADGCLRRSHVSKRQPTSPDDQIVCTYRATEETYGDGGETVRRSCYRGSEDANS